MKKTKWIVSIVLGAALLFGAGMGVGAAGSEPGSNVDPIVTKSYVDSQITEIKQDGMYQEVTLASGKKLSCGAGAQIIVISGEAKSTASLVDITDGSKLAKNKKISQNHSYLVTSKNTGIKATKNAKVFVIGNYSVK